MNGSEQSVVEERYVSLLAAGEQALAHGSTLEFSEAPTDVQEDLKRDLACVGLLRQLMPAVSASTDETLPPGEDAQPPITTSLGRFQIRRELGRGTFGIVYLAYDPSLDRKVALKVPRIDALADPAPRRRFQREARPRPDSNTRTSCRSMRRARSDRSATLCRNTVPASRWPGGSRSETNPSFSGRRPL